MPGILSKSKKHKSKEHKEKKLTKRKGPKHVPEPEDDAALKPKKPKKELKYQKEKLKRMAKREQAANNPNAIVLDEKSSTDLEPLKKRKREQDETELIRNDSVADLKVDGSVKHINTEKKKHKKQKADASQTAAQVEASKKRKRDQDDIEPAEIDVVPSDEVVVKEKKKKQKKQITNDSQSAQDEVPKKRKRDQDDSVPNELDFIPLSEVGSNTASSNKEKKKKKKKKKKKQKTDVKNSAQDEAKVYNQTEATTEGTDAEVNGRTAEALESQEDYARSEMSKKHRFIAFIGNLPFTATKEDVAKHFKSVEPASVRLISDKDTGKPKGFAFVEFNRFDHMKSCLKLYHHSNFNDGKSPARRINVELTAGGGGSSENRKQKIQAKNEKLREERKRKIEKDGADKKQRQNEPADTGKEEPEPEETSHGMHPSRLARMQT